MISPIGKEHGSVLGHGIRRESIGVLRVSVILHEHGRVRLRLINPFIGGNRRVEVVDKSAQCFRGAVASIAACGDVLSGVNKAVE